MSLRTLLSRYGGHMVMMGQPKTSDYDIHNPKDSFLELFQTYNVVYDKHTRYMSSYKTYAPYLGLLTKLTVIISAFLNLSMSLENSSCKRM
jgi:hypothetical protein